MANSSGINTLNDVSLRNKSENETALGFGGNAVHTLNKVQSKPVSQLRRSLSQFLAAFVKNLLVLDLGMVIAFPTIVIPPLLDAAGDLRFTETQASWFGSIVYFNQPLGSLTAAVTLDWLGRKRAMIFLNLPFLCCWLALYFTHTITMLFVLTGIMGFTIGSIEASILTYVGEISDPRLRGTLTSLAEIAEYIGFVFMFFLGTVTDWRTSALISALVPVITIISLLQIPETPIWLLSRGRSEEALKSLCWLRGWVTPDQVENEFKELVRYNKASKLLNEIPKQGNLSIEKHGTSVDSLMEKKLPFKAKLKDFCRREMMMPMFLVCSFFFFTYGSGMLAIRPYMVPVLTSLELVMDPFLATTVFTTVGLGGCVFCTVTVRFIGKRPLALISILGCAISCISLGTYAFFIEELEGHRQPWMPMVMMVSLAFSTGIGMDPLPWMYLSEVFPFRGRSLASGVAAAISYIFGFIATKSFLVLEDILTLSGVFYLYAIFNVVGFIFFYIYLPETEGMSMEEIEESYKKRRKI